MQHGLGQVDVRITSRIDAHLEVEDLRDAVEALPQGPRARRGEAAGRAKSAGEESL